jgi:hypothetical protein
MHRWRALAFGAALAIACGSLGFFNLRQASGVGPFNNPTDFVAFYCAGAVASRGADPYRAEPLRSCERAAFALSQVPMVRYLVVPGPLPGYDIAFFGAYARFVPFRLACVLWAGLLAVCVGLTVWTLSAVTGLRPVFVFAALAGSDLYASLVPGQLVPLVVAALAGCGYFLSRGAPRLAAACACVTLVEPHLGLPVALALFVWEPAARLRIATGVAALALLALAFLGPAANAEYVARVLPAQAATEGLEFSRQYGLSAAAHALGIPAAASVALGALSYLVMLALGVAFARRAARRFDSAALLAFVPAAAVLVGGAYLHIASMAAAVPLALVLCARSGVLRPVAFAATAALAIPWQTVITASGFAELFPPRGFVDPGPLLARVSDGTRLAQDAWAAWIGTMIDRDHRTPFEIALFKIPTWGALGALAWLVTRTVATRVASRVE